MAESRQQCARWRPGCKSQAQPRWALGSRAEADIGSSEIDQKIRHQLFLEEVAMDGVVDDQELRYGAGTVPARTGGDLGTLSVQDLPAKVQPSVAERR